MNIMLMVISDEQGPSTALVPKVLMKAILVNILKICTKPLMLKF